jgi:hypothetical protein
VLVLVLAFDNFVSMPYADPHAVASRGERCA